MKGIHTDRNMEKKTARQCLNLEPRSDLKWKPRIIFTLVLQRIISQYYSEAGKQLALILD